MGEVHPTPTERPAPVSEDRGAALAAPTAPKHPEPSTVDDAFYRELGLLQRAERAIRSNDPVLARSLLGELDQQFPKGKLLEERSAAGVMAGCQNSLDPASQSAARRFVGFHPQSVYAARIRNLCELATTESDPPGH
jgi:hypothetical protein